MAWSPRRWQRRRARRLLAAAVALFLLIPAASAASPAPAPDAQSRLEAHERHLSARTAGGGSTQQAGTITDHFRLLGHHQLHGPTNGDVWFYDHGGRVGRYAYVGTWSDPCSGIGVKIVDVNDPTHPRLVATTSTWPGVSHEGSVASDRQATC